MSEVEVLSLQRELRALSEKSDRQHAENRKSISDMIASFNAAMQQQRDQFQQTLNQQYIEHRALERKTDEAGVLLRLVVGNGQPGEGRLGQLEVAVEMLKKFRWQALAIVSLLLLAAEHSGVLFGRHG